MFKTWSNSKGNRHFGSLLKRSFGLKILYSSGAVIRHMAPIHTLQENPRWNCRRNMQDFLLRPAFFFKTFLPIFEGEHIFLQRFLFVCRVLLKIRGKLHQENWDQNLSFCLSLRSKKFKKSAIEGCRIFFSLKFFAVGFGVNKFMQFVNWISFRFSFPSAGTDSSYTRFE